jgi:hypothetical protein
MSTRRAKIILIDEDHIMDLLNWKVNQPDYVRLPVIPKLPKGTKITNVTYDHIRASFMFRVEHDSFPETQSGETLPFEMATTIGFELVEAKEIK